MEGEGGGLMCLKRTKVLVKRVCPHCGSKLVRKEKVLGLCPCNIWVDFVCDECKYRWEKSSEVDKEAILRMK